MGKRRKSRELTLQLLYQYEIRKEPPDQMLKEFWGIRKKIHPDIRSFSDSIFMETLEHLEKIDEVITELLLNWKLSRLSLVDKNILRFAICEICFRDDIPEKVTVDEAIEVAKRFGGEDSSGFINGILDRLLQDKETFMEKLSATPP
jgi:N utilization substance protein B